jgi:hypothetical protein
MSLHGSPRPWRTHARPSLNGARGKGGGGRMADEVDGFSNDHGGLEIGRARHKHPELVQPLHLRHGLAVALPHTQVHAAQLGIDISSVSQQPARRNDPRSNALVFAPAEKP